MEPLSHLAQYLRSRAPLPQNEIDLICGHFQVERVRRETAVVVQGRRYGKLIFVVEGILRVFVPGPEGEDIVKNFVEANDFFADVECLEKDQPAVVNLSTITDCTLLTLSKVDGGRLAKQLPAWQHMMRQGAMQAMYEMVRKQEFLRVGSAADQYRHFVEHFPNLVQQVPLKDIASYLRITQSSLSRIRKQGW
jgi:CRP-like cAMP-binding protein